MGKYLDKNGLQYFYSKLKEKFVDKTTIENKLDSLTGALTWKGKFDTLPAVTDYEAGNVVGVGNKEYVLTVTGSTKAWEELGDEGSYLLKSVAEETYLKKAAGEVTTANIADSAVISTKLATGARKPIILTPETTEVDEETYQKLLSDNLLSDDVDVMFKTEYDNLCTLTYKSDNGDAWNFYFTCFSFEGDTIDVTYIYAYIVNITKNSPHTCHITENINTDLQSFINGSGYLDKYTLSPVLKEIDLTGTDADRKAKLDQFAKDWKYLTGASNLSGARFVGNVSMNDGATTSVLLSYDMDDNYSGISMSDDVDESQLKKIVVHPNNGSVASTPLFSHLEAITIKTSNTTEAMNANKAAIQTYVNNLNMLGVDTTKGFIVPVRTDNNFYGCLTGEHFSVGKVGFLSGTIFSIGGENYIKDIYINPMGRYGELVNIQNDNSLNTTSKDLVGAINEVNTLAKSKGNGTITEVKMNGVSKGTSGVVDLGTVITAHQDISGKQDKLISGTNIKTINGESVLGSGDITISSNVMAVDTGDIINDATVEYATKSYVDGLVGDINSVLESIING